MLPFVRHADTGKKRDSLGKNLVGAVSSDWLERHVDIKGT
jgi:hypothetical protein